MSLILNWASLGLFVIGFLQMLSQVASYAIKDQYSFFPIALLLLSLFCRATSLLLGAKKYEH